jgi:hypothetical protein
MTARSMSGALDRAAVAGLLLAGSSDAAEAAVFDGIAALEPDAPCGDTLVKQTAMSSIRRRAEFPERSEGVSILPLELKRLLLLAPDITSAPSSVARTANAGSLAAERVRLCP